jgi:hypothetical protein
MSSHDLSPEELAEADRRADVKAILLVFTALVLGAVHFISGWSFHF